ncbi:nucleotide exchange factor GrpE [Lachnospiraceae bacterium C1.1]|nr:nucleotide exchange factor GrpE [Lachnospiraceae bacterium C1.1]
MSTEEKTQEEAQEINIEEASEETTKSENVENTENSAEKSEEGDAEVSEDSAASEKEAEASSDDKINELNDRYVRLMAEFENFRKRTDKEKEMMFETGAKSVIEKILPVVDNFERALEMAKPEEGAEPDPFMDGIDKIYKQLMTEFDNMGVKPIEAVGKPFDPQFHNAVMQEESEDAESGTVTKEMQKGYMYRDSVVRHSMVVVAQ